MIRLQAIGNLGRDGLLKQVNGKNVINFSVAHTERYKDGSGEQKERTTWLDCSYWTDRTAVAQFLKKGRQIYVEGTPDVRSFTRPDGSSGTVLTLRVTNVQLLGGPDERGPEHVAEPIHAQPRPAAANPSPQQTPAADDMLDDLPF